MKLGLFSGGKDSLVACHLLSEQNELDGVLYCKTGIGLEENFNYVKDTCQTFGWHLEIVEPKKGETYENFINKFGFPHSGIHSAIMGYLKYHPIRAWYRQHKGTIFISGRRKNESRRRKMTLKQDTSVLEGMTFYSKVFNWSTKDVWDYIKKNELKRCPVYETLHMSGDCLCGAFSESGEAELIATFHQKMADRIKSLEQQYGGRWGNQSSMKGALNQSKLDSYICQECLRMNV